MAVGALMSFKFTTALQVAMLPDASVALSITVLLPTLEQLNVPGVVVSVKLQLSVLPLLMTEGIKVAVPLVPRMRVAFLHNILGGVTSLTVTLKEQEAVWPLAAVTKKVLVVVPMGKVEPAARPAVRAVVEPEQLSVPTGTV
jgi:hypothetical protein